MSNKAKASSVPKLRFPEFRWAGEWALKKLRHLAENLDNLRVPITSSERAIGNTPYYGASGVVDYVSGYIFNEDLLCVSEDGANLVARTYPIAFPISGKTWVNNHAHVLRFETTYTQKFVEVYLNSIKLDDFITGMAQPKLNRAMLDSIPIPYPDILEQKKIADCLSSLEELIAVQARKVDVFKTHKKGLMQQLFPSEGETQPHLRFPEFQNAGEWKECLLESFIEEFRAKSTIQDEYEVMTSARSGLVRQREYYDNDRITERENIGFNVIPPNYITYRSRSDDRQFYFNENNLGIFGIVSVYYPVFRVVNGSNRFLIELLSAFSRVVGKYSVGTSQTVLSLNQLGRIRLPFPPTVKEQQRISSCLSSIGDLITAETQKLEALKSHKNGLTQQLFPSTEEEK